MKIGLMALATFAFATSAFASTGENPSAQDNPFARDKAILNLKGLDLSTAQGQQSLSIRMDQAARSVCGERLANVHLDLERRAQECRTAVLADVRSQIEARTAKAATASPVRVALAR